MPTLTFRLINFIDYLPLKLLFVWILLRFRSCSCLAFAACFAAASSSGAYSSNVFNNFTAPSFIVLSFEIIFCRENFISITAGDIDCNLSLFYLLKDDKKAADNFSIADFRGRKYLPYYSSDGTKSVNGMKIIPCNTEEIKTIIQQGITYTQLYRIFGEAHKANITPNLWYNQAIKNKL